MVRQKNKIEQQDANVNVDVASAEKILFGNKESAPAVDVNKLMEEMPPIEESEVEPESPAPMLEQVPAIEPTPAPTPAPAPAPVKNDTFSIEDAVKLVMGQVEAGGASEVEAKLKAGWIQVAPNMPLVPPAIAKELLDNFDPSTSSVDISHLRGKLVEEKFAKPKAPSAVAVPDSPFRTYESWQVYAPQKSSDLSNAWSLKMRQGCTFNSNHRAPKKWDKIVTLSSTDKMPSNKIFIKTGIIYDTALFKQPYVIKMNPSWVYGTRVGSARYDLALELVYPQVFDVDGEAAIIVRCSGCDMDAQGRFFMICSDKDEYIADIQFLAPVVK